MAHSQACLAAIEFTALVCTGCGPDLCWLLTKGCVRPEFCSVAEDGMAREIDPCRYLSLEDLHPVAPCQRLGKELRLPERSSLPSTWKPYVDVDMDDR